ncbi:response regulator transcription factor [Actinoplanes derwentensis]|uniref:Regulatory protein, luxR family n=1 Tax=Actinoplanes derwentensis TaxID=113562 RepID=A0A1H1PLY4_9ACTN|nr:response regulator transcription factor [Actinoplanes derwentensis]GID90331.1 hypothetical protein Ade03nite_92550 [Actinoplanes derwentensis]SDS12166.1 regulatory protein, luxR family [Actinoplanes derwentensis]
MTDTVRVLIADDDPLVRVGLSLVLGADPVIRIVGEAGDGAEAVAMTRELKPDVVLMDVRMPRMDGLAATEELRRDGPSPAIIVLTTFDTDANLLGALRLGANGFLLKDIAPTEIISAVRRAAAGESILAPAVLPRLIDYAVGRSDPANPGSTRGTGSGEDLSRGSREEQGRGSWEGSGRDSLGSSGRGSGRSGGWGSREDLGRGSGESADRAGDGARERALAVLERLAERERQVAEAVATGASNAQIGTELHMSVPTVKAYVSRVLDKLGCVNRVQVAVLVHEAGIRRA